MAREKIECEVHEEPMENENGIEVMGVTVVCGRCGHEASSFGTEEASIKRSLALLREECPEGESNFYVAED